MNYIENVITTEATRANVRKAIPVLIYWAKSGQTEHTYDDLIKSLGYKRFSGIGHVLGAVQEVINLLAVKKDKDIPTLNSLCKDKKDKIPSQGFDYVISQYNSFSKDEKRRFVKLLDSAAVAYPHWDWVLKELGLSEYKPFTKTEIEEITNPKRGHGVGEGEEHKKLKEYICSHPEAIGATNVVSRKTEHLLPSGDKLDVYFELEDGSRLAVEVKSSISNDADITRGIFQCVKYKAVMSALQSIDTKDYEVQVLLVTARDLSDLQVRLIKELSINYIQIQKDND